MRELSLAIQQAQAAVLARDVAELEKQTGRQQSLCQSIAALGSWCAPADDSTGREMQNAAERVGRLNRVLGALLRRTRRSMKIVALAQASRADTYLPATILRASSWRGRE